jgi:hypothetical protein
MKKTMMNKKIEVKFEQLSIADLYTLLEYSVENLPNNRKRYLIIHKYVHNELNKRMNFLTHQPMNATETQYVEKFTNIPTMTTGQTKAEVEQEEGRKTSWRDFTMTDEIN